MKGLVGRALRPFQQFAATESAGGVVLLLVTATALIWANSPWSASYFALWEHSASVKFVEWEISKSLEEWINDGLMSIFFFLVGLEIKRELIAGELASPRRAALPIAAAIGGMIVPALVFAAFTWGGIGQHGWAIPMATDIAFALGVLSLLGDRVPTVLKVFLTALAIVDDIGAVVVIAAFYNHGLDTTALAAACGALALLLLCNRAGVRKTAPYAVLGFALWLCILNSGIHATIAGVLLALTIPANTRIDAEEFTARASAALSEFETADLQSASILSSTRRQEALQELDRASSDMQAPLLRIEHALHGVVAFVIMPLFAFANAGVEIRLSTIQLLEWRIVAGVALGLLVGKFVGIRLATWVAAASGLATPLPKLRRGVVAGVSCLGGIGFTMALFIASLAFGPGHLLDSAKVGILGGSLVAGIVGWAIVRFAAARDASDAEHAALA
jgi:NhaA family Na+:H+ antiporter